jgi:DNA-binding NtrC family response regulator
MGPSRGSFVGSRTGEVTPIKEGWVKKNIFVMVLDDEPIVGERLKPILEKKGFQVETFTESQKALERLEEKQFHVLVTDLKMSGPSGMDVLRFLKDRHLDTQAIVITGYATIERAREAQYLNAEFVSKPFKLEEIAKLVVRAAKKSAVGQDPEPP